MAATWRDKYRLTGHERILKRVEKQLDKRKMWEHLVVTVGDDELSWCLNPESTDQEVSWKPYQNGKTDRPEIM